MAAYKTKTLTEAQQKLVLDLYETTKLGDMVPMIFPGAKPDGRTMEGRSIQAFLAGVNLGEDGKILPPKPVPVVTAIPELLPLPEPAEPAAPLTDEQKALIEKFAPRCRTTLELAQTVYNDKNVRSMSRQYKLVWEHKQTLFPDTVAAEEEPVMDASFRPPNTIIILIGMVNRMVPTGRKDTKLYTWGALKGSEERCLYALMGYIRTYSFIYTASQYDKQVDRELFISQFFRWTHDKPDLTQIEIDQMILAAHERVNIAQIDRTIQRIDRLQEEISKGNELDENGKVRKLGMTDVELINAVRTKHDAAKKRLSDLMSDLEEVRSKRLDAKKDRYGSIIDILDAFMKDEDIRNRVFIQEGINEKDDDKAEVERLSGVDELMALISGQSKEEGGA